MFLHSDIAKNSTTSAQPCQIGNFIDSFDWKLVVDVVTVFWNCYGKWFPAAFAIPIEGKWFGITYAFITHSRHERKTFDQEMTPYTAEGRRRYVNYRNKHKLLPCDRPSINTPEDIALACYADGKGWKANFEYFMNREYAYNRDKGKCKCCGTCIWLYCFGNSFFQTASAALFILRSIA